ncbi:MAG: hypothetical protein JRN52_05030 [Nitrososphaerota archaeon]|nr:hypothetical protein [Nitrososphaerota archaeon]
MKSAYRISATILAFAGGILLINSGYRTSSFLLTLLSLSESQKIVPDVVRTILLVAIPILTVIISLGGILVIAGGVLLLFKHKFSASVLIALGGGIGLIGIIIALGYSVYSAGIFSIITHIEYWIGVLIASTSRALGKKS